MLRFRQGGSGVRGSSQSHRGEPVRWPDERNSRSQWSRHLWIRRSRHLQMVKFLNFTNLHGPCIVKWLNLLTRFCSQDLLFYGPLDKCPICEGTLEFTGKRYICNGAYSEWATCTFNTMSPPRREEAVKLPNSVLNTPAGDVILIFLCLVSDQPPSITQLRHI